jgi:hypothetical protein
MNVDHDSTGPNPTIAPSPGQADPRPTGEAPHLSRGAAGGPQRAYDDGDDIDVGEWIQSTKATVERTVRANPYASVAAAAGIGYVLGGGIPRWAVGGLVRYAAKTAIAAAIAGAAVESAD